MGDLTKNISRNEVACKCGCGYDEINPDTAAAVQQCHDHFETIYERPLFILITSGCRCVAHNRKIGSEDTSKHIRSLAIDFSLYYLDRQRHEKVFIPPKIVFDYLCSQYPNRYGIGLYDSFVHFDIRNKGPARW
jgi:hypothetical protein